jgi:hypothetical protein
VFEHELGYGLANESDDEHVKAGRLINVWFMKIIVIESLADKQF